MIKSICGHQMDDDCQALDQMFHEAETMISKVYDGMLKNMKQPLDEAEKMGHRIEQNAKQLTQSVLSTMECTIMDSASIIEVCGQLEKIGYSADKMAGAVRTKIDDGVLFSDRAVVELKEFFSGVLTELQNAHDLVLTRNLVLVDHIRKSVDVYEEKSRQFAEEHHDRMIKGICLPKSSLIYLVVLEALKDTLWYIRGIAQALKES